MGKSKVKNITLLASESEIAYLAGLFDGEGCLRLLRGEAPHRVTCKYGYTLQMGVTLCEPAIPVHEFCKKVGWGTVSVVGRQPGWAPASKWQGSGNVQVAQFAAMLLPYLRVKRKQALLAIAWSEFRATLGGRLGVEGHAFANKVYQGFTALNQRGEKTLVVPDTIEEILER